MKYGLLLMLSFLLTDPIKMSKINSAKAKAKDAFQAGEYQKAATIYTYLIDSLGVQEDEVLLNRAHAFYLQKDTAHAQSDYQALAQSSKNSIASKADLHLGLIANQNKKSEQALNLFKQAIKADPANEEARYNYEMLKKKLDAKKKEEEKKNKDKNDKNKKQEPSEFAKKLKAQADRLVAARKYKSAYDLMMDGLKKDQTVSTYQKFIDRIKVVDDIN
jgi:Ca-activated chloride channel family protein